MKKINFKQPKYIFPLIALPFVCFIGYQAIDLFSKDDKKEQAQKDLSTSLGKVETPIMNKNDAYDKMFENTNDSRSMIQNFEKESDSLYNYSDNLNDAQKRYLDSLEYERKRNANNKVTKIGDNTYYRPNNSAFSHSSSQSQDDKDYERSKEMIRMLNESQQPTASSKQEKEEKEYDPVKGLREQMLFLDSLEKSKDPEAIRQKAASEHLKANKEKREAFLNRSLEVTKANNLGNFNHISKEKEGNNIKAVIDENIKGYLGSRIRIRLLEDIFIGKKQKRLVRKGSFLYAEIAGFSQQRVYLSIVSVMTNNEIYPINLSSYDMDGLKGLYVPASAFREMIRELGASSVQGVNVETGQGFFTSLASNLFRSTSEAVAAIIRKNKVKLKYNSYIYLINEQDLNKNEE